MELDELKNIWKENKAKDIIPGKLDYESLLAKLRKAERKVYIRYILMTFFMAVAFYTLGGKVLSLKKYDDLTYAGIYLIFAAMISVGIMVWSTVIILSKNDTTSPGIDFLKKVKKKFNRRRLIRKIVIPVYLFAITIGISLVYIEVFSPYSTATRIAVHVGVVIFLLAISFLARRREIARDKRVYAPIEEQIDSLLKEYSE